MGSPADPAEPGAGLAGVGGDLAAADASPEMGLLKRLLFRAEQARLDALQHETEALAARVGDNARFEEATAEVLAGALRRAEIANHRELSQAMAPLVLAAIRSEIVNSRDMMVEALYPITGRLVAAAVASAFRDLVATINARLDRLLSTQMWRLRLRALATGRPISEILLEAAQRPQVRLMLALERGSGRLLASWRADGPAHEATDLESPELVGGLIAAISQFAAEAFSSQHGELRTLDMGASRILLRASARLIVAAEFLGEPHAGDEARMDRALYALIEDAPDGPNDAALARLAAEFAQPQAKKTGAARKFVLAALALLLFGWATSGPVRNFIWERRLRDAYRSARAQQAQLAGWPLRLSLDSGGRIAALRGLAPPDVDLGAFSRALAAAGTPYRIETQVLRVATVGSAAAGLAESAASFEKRIQSEQALATARGDALGARLDELEKWRTAQQAEANAPQKILARLARDTVIRFGDGADFVDPDEARRQVAALAAAAKASGGGLRVVGYSDPAGSEAQNLKLSQQRADAVAAALVAEGVESSNVVAVGRGDQAAIEAPGGTERRRNRRVTFETLSQAEQKQ